MKTSIALSDITGFHDEPRIRDTLLGERLAFERPRKIRDMIARNREELAVYGDLPCSGAKSPDAKGRGRPAMSYFLNEGQALVICALSRTAVAVDVRHALVTTFMEYRTKPVRVRAHRRSLPKPSAPPLGDRARMESFFRAFRDQPDALADWAVTQAEQLQAVAAQLTGRKPH